MFDDKTPEIQVFDYDEFSNHLLEQGLQCSPAEIHGALCGVLAAGAKAEPEWGLARMSEALQVDLHGDLADQTLQLYRVSAKALMDEEFQFHPLLPDDSVEIAERTESLALWCSGFLAGFTQQATQSPNDPKQLLSKDSNEVLVDLAAIAEAEADAELDENELEESYFNVVEYLRFAVLNVFMDMLESMEANQADT